MEVYINDLAVFLPNAPVGNRDVETVLGKVNGLPSRIRAVILRNNKIQTRYYAIDPKTRRFTHTNAELCAEAVRALTHGEFSMTDIDLLCCGTSTPDLINPAHALMVQGELGMPPCETVSPGGICLSGMSALKYAFNAIALGLAQSAVVTASELASSYIRSEFFEASYSSNPDLDANPHLAFSADFLRWMLSDGAGALYLSPWKNREGLSLRVEWLDMLSYAGEYETCMYIGGIKTETGSVRGWRSGPGLEEVVSQGCLSIRQDVELLNEKIVDVTVDRALLTIAGKRGLRPETIDHFLPHYSSEYFRERLYDHLEAIGFPIPYDKWFTNLTTKGNTGSASLFIMLEEFFRSGRVKRGDRLLCFVPESGRFSAGYLLLTAV